ncbi:MAG: hypothetical protein NVS3B12_27600 [Acidimicrobiales bacterium]
MTADVVAWLTATLDEVEREAHAAAASATWVTDAELLDWHLADEDTLVGSCPAFATPPHAHYTQTGPTYTEQLMSIEAWDGTALLTHIAAHDPATVLASVEVDRAILVELADALAGSDYDYVGYDATQHLVRLVASRYRHRPGWQEEWTP